MDFEIVIAQRAIGQLDEIAAWIAKDNPERARSFRTELLDRVTILATFPELGSLLRSSNRYRKLVLGAYLIIYEINREQGRVEVTSFRHGSQRPHSS